MFHGELTVCFIHKALTHTQLRGGRARDGGAERERDETRKDLRGGEMNSREAEGGLMESE